MTLAKARVLWMGWNGLASRAVSTGSPRRGLEKGGGLQAGSRIGEAVGRAAADGVPPPVPVFRFSAFVSLCVYVLSCTTGLSGLKQARHLIQS